MRLRLPLPRSNEEICGKPERWYAWRPIAINRQLYWLEDVERTRYHSPMGYWYWAYAEIKPTNNEYPGSKGS